MKKICTKLFAPAKKCFFNLRYGARAEKQEAVLSICSWCLFLFVLAGISIYTIFTYRAEFHSDAATAAMIAPFQTKEGKLFLDEWRYSQDFWPFFIFNPVVALKPIFHTDYLATQVSVLIQTLLIVLLMILLLRKVCKSNLNILICCVIFSVGSAGIWIGPLFGQGQYGNVILWVLLGIWLTLSCLHADKPWKRYTLLAILGLFIAYLNSTGVRYLPFFVAPMIVALAAKIILDADQQMRKHCLWAIGSIVLGTLAGHMAFRALYERYHFNVGNAGSTMLASRDIVKNIPEVLYSFLTLAGGAKPGTKLASLGGMTYLYSFFAFCLLAILPIWIAIRFCRRKMWNVKPDAFILVVFFLVVTAISLISILMTSLDHTGRYLIVAIYSGFLLLPILLEELEGHVGRKFIALALTVPLVFCGMRSLNEPLGKPLVEDEVISCLKENDLQVGYADFWVADKFTVLSNHEVEVAHVDLKSMAPSLFMSCPEQYQDTQHDRYFLLLRKSDIEAANQSPIEQYMGKPKQILTCDPYEIWVYDKPFCGTLPDWPV